MSHAKPSTVSLLARTEYSSYDSRKLGHLNIIRHRNTTAHSEIERLTEGDDICSLIPWPQSAGRLVVRAAKDTLCPAKSGTGT